MLSADLPIALATGLDPKNLPAEPAVFAPPEAPAAPLAIAAGELIATPLVSENNAPVTATNEIPLQPSLDPPEVEPNNTRIDATYLPLTEDPAGSGLFKGVGSGRQDPANNQNYWSDPDYWRLEVMAGDVVSLTVATPEHSLNTYVELHNAADSSLVSDNDSGPDTDAFISQYTIPSSGSYYAVVGKYYYETNPGNYELQVELARGIQQETDYNYSNDSVGGANTLTLMIDGANRRATVAGTVMGPEGSHPDEDYFSLGLLLNTGNQVELNLRQPSWSTLNGKVTLVDSSGAAVADSDSNALDGHFLGTIAANGNYYARVEANSGAGPYAQYLLDVDTADLVPPRLTGLTGLPADGSTTADPQQSFSLTCSEPLDAATVNAGNRLVWSYGGHFYTLTDSAATWSAAQSEAAALGGNLATVNDALEQQWLMENFGRFGSTWIGYTDQATEETWVWANGETAAYTNWADGEPDSGNDYDWAYHGVERALARRPRHL